MTSFDNMSQSQVWTDLRDDLETLKKKLIKPDAKAEELILEIESLKESIHELTNIFQRAVELTQEEDLSRTLKEKLEAVLKQNETIARGMVAISDKVDEFVDSRITAAITPRPVMNPATASPPGRVAPMPLAHTGMDELNLPPPPPVTGKKRQGLFQ